MARKESDVESLYEAAKKAREYSYSPYSNRRVGAAVRLSDGRVFTGCNIENSSYGATICAERVAINKAVSETREPIIITDVLVVTDATPAWPPCGVCRQVIAEFGPDARIHAANLEGERRTVAFSDLFPEAFTPDHLKS